MNHKIKNILINTAVLIIAIIIGMLVNMALIVLGGQLIPLPEGVSPMNAENWKFSYFIFPFLAHAIGTFAGAFFAAKYSSKNTFIQGIIVGLFFLLGGIYMVFVIPAPEWFIITDLGLAYIPMSILGIKLAK